MKNEVPLQERAKAAGRLVLLVLIVSAPLVWLKLERAPGASRDHLTFNSQRVRDLAGNAPGLIVAGAVIAAIAFGLKRAGPKLHEARVAAGRRVDALTRTRAQRLGLAAIPFALLLVFPAINAQLGFEARLTVANYLNLLVFMAIYAVLSVGLNITVGQTGLLVLGYAAFWGIGAYSYAIVAQHGHGLLLAIPTAVAASALLGLVVGLPSLRLRGDYLALVTLGFGETLRYILRNLSSITGGEQGLTIPFELKPPSFEWASYRLDRQTVMLVGCLLLLAACVASTARLKRSRVGRAWIAIREDELAASCMGISSTYYKLLAFVLSAIWAGLAGVAYAGHIGFVSPKMVELDESILVLSMVVLGGMGRISGAILGAVLLYLLKWILQDRFSQFNDYRNITLGAIMIVLMIFRPQGLLGSERVKAELSPGSEDAEEEGDSEPLEVRSP